MLFGDRDEDTLGPTPSHGEARLATNLGEDGLRSIDEMIRRHVGRRWSKVARILIEALQAGGFSLDDDDAIALHLRRRLPSRASRAGGS